MLFALSIHETRALGCSMDALQVIAMSRHWGDLLLLSAPNSAHDFEKLPICHRSRMSKGFCRSTSAISPKLNQKLKRPIGESQTSRKSRLKMEVDYASEVSIWLPQSGFPNKTLRLENLNQIKHRTQRIQEITYQRALIASRLELIRWLRFMSRAVCFMSRAVCCQTDNQSLIIVGRWRTLNFWATNPVKPLKVSNANICWLLNSPAFPLKKRVDIEPFKIFRRSSIFRIKLFNES